MRLLLERFYKTDKCTVGKLFVDGEYYCYTLEPPIKDDGSKPRAIPVGTYPVVIDFSEHFQRRLPHLLQVLDFEGVRMHPGNTDKDTLGCILTGHEWSGGDFIGHSREVFDTLFAKLEQAQDVKIEIS